MTAHDAIRALKEELAALVDVLTTMKRREDAAEIALSGLEGELNAIRKLRGFCQREIEMTRGRISTLEATAGEKK